MKLLIFTATLIVASSENSEEVEKCVSKFCEKDPNYPVQVLEELELWQYKFDAQPEMTKNKRSVNPNSDDFLIETKLCDSKISFARPQKLTNTQGKFRTIVNHQNYTQFVRTETCNSENFPCTFNVYPQSVRSFCHQDYKILKLLALDDRNNCLVTEKFVIPSSCACVIDKEGLLKGVKKDLLQGP